MSCPGVMLAGKRLSGNGLGNAYEHGPEVRTSGPCPLCRAETAGSRNVGFRPGGRGKGRGRYRGIRPGTALVRFRCD